MFFLQGVRQLSLHLKSPPDSDGVTYLWNPGFALSLEAEYFPLRCRGSQFLLSQKSAAQPCLALRLLTSDAN